MQNGKTKEWIRAAVVVLLAINTGAWLGSHLRNATPPICAAPAHLSSVVLDAVGDEVVGVRVVVEPGLVEGGKAELSRVALTDLSEARLEVDGAPRPAPLTVSFTPRASSWSFDLRQVRRGAPFSASLTTLDGCGETQLEARSFEALLSGDADASGSAAAPRLRSPSAAFDQPGVALGLYQQSFPLDLSALDGYERAAGAHLPIVHWFSHWGGWAGQFNREDFERVSRRGAVPMVTWEPWAGLNDPSWSLQQAILSGRNDAYIQSWARGLSEYGRPVLLRFAHEMHTQPLYPWVVGNHGNTAEQYVAAWRHTRAIFARFETRNVLWVWNPNAQGSASAATLAPIYRSLYPGDDAVDWLGLNVYNTGPALDWGAPSWRSFDEVVREPYRAITSVSGRPLVLSEVGSAEAGGDKAGWIGAALAPDLPDRLPRVKALVWFDVDKEQPWQLRSSPTAFEAFAAAWQQSTFSVDPSMFRR